MSKKFISDNKNYNINNGEYGNLSCNNKTLIQINTRLEYMINKHSKVLCVRLDITSPTDLQDFSFRKSIGRIMEDSKRKIDSYYKKSRNKTEIQDVRKIEYGKDGREHIHLFIILNGNCVQSGWTIRNIVNDVVKKHLNTAKDGLVNYSDSNRGRGILIDRSSDSFQSQYEDAIYAASYLAKFNSTEDKPKYKQFSSASRLPMK